MNTSPYFNAKACKRSCQWKVLCIPRYAIKAASDSFYVFNGIADGYMSGHAIEAVSCQASRKAAGGRLDGILAGVGGKMDFDIVYVRDLMRTIKEKDAVVIDLREKKEYQAGHFPGAISMPLDDTDVYENILDRDKYYILYCDHGGSSMQLARYLGRRGYSVASVIGGFSVM